MKTKFKTGYVKIMLRKFLFLLLFSILENPAYAQNVSEFSTEGTEFWLAFGQNNFAIGPNGGTFNDIGSFPVTYTSLKLKIRIAASQPDTIKFTFTETGYIYYLYMPDGGVKDYMLEDTEKEAVYSPRGITEDKDSAVSNTSRKSVYIESKHPISAYALNYSSQYASDATNLLPINNMGNSYYQISYKSNYNNQDSFFSSFFDGYLVVAIQDNTDLFANNSKVATLDKGEVYYYYGPTNTDLTGTYITSSNPVAFYVNNTGTRIPETSLATEILFQQLLPLNTWGTDFMVPTTNRTKDIVRVMASMDETTVTYNGGTRRSGGTVTGSNTVTLSKGQYLELELQNTDNGSFISSGNKPIAVCAYLVGNQYASENPGSESGDPAMAWIPPVEQLISSTAVAPFRLDHGKNHYALLIVSSDSEDQTKAIKGTSENITLTGTWKKNSNYSYYALDISSDIDAVYTFSNPNGIIVLMYGYGDSESYYYLAGSATRDLNPHFLVNEEHFQDIYDKIYCNENNFDFEAFIYSRKPGSGTDGYDVGSLRWYVKKDNGNFDERIDHQDQKTWSDTFESGTYEIRMDVVNLSGSTDTCITRFVVSSGTNPTFTVAPEISCTNDTIIYTTQSDMHTYQWSITNAVKDIDYTIISEGDAPSETWRIKWITGGNRIVSVNYANENGCLGSPASVNVSIQACCPFTNLINGVLYIKDYSLNEALSTSIAGDGSTWETAYDNLGNALKIAKEFPDCIKEIWVAEGVYHPTYDLHNDNNPSDSRDLTFQIVSGIHMYGGFPANASTNNNTDKNNILHRNWNTWKTILSGDIGVLNNNSDNAYHVVTAVDLTDTTEINGFSITDGYADMDSYVVVNSHSVYRNTGGGLAIFSDVASDTSSLYIKNVIISNNNGNLGGGVYFNGKASPYFVNTLVSNNAAVSGGGIYKDGDDGQSRGLAVSSIYATFTNVTIAGNTGNGIYAVPGSISLAIYNSIIWGNPINDKNPSNAPFTLIYSNSIIQGIFDKDPLFADEENNDYRLKKNSPAINTGDNSYYEDATGGTISATEKDLLASERLIDANIDMGVYEYKTPQYTVSGTVFPFVYHDNIAFDSLFKTTACLYALPISTDPLSEIETGTPLYSENLVFYDGTAYIPGTPKYPGISGNTNNPGVPINWQMVGKDIGEINNTAVNDGEKPNANIGLYTFKDVKEGQYILAISRSGYTTRYALVNIESSASLGHREILPGDINRDGNVSITDLSLLNARTTTVFPDSSYKALYDLNNDGYIDHTDAEIIQTFLQVSFLMYTDSYDWIIHNTNIK